MYKSPVKFTVPYGMAIHAKAFRPHLLDPRRSRVTVFENRPELTRYEISWQCGKIPKLPIRFLRSAPEGVEICRACLLVRDRLEYYEVMEAKDILQGPAPF